MTNRIAEFRHRKGWTQSNLAEAIGYASWMTISKLEREELSPKLKTLRAIAQALDCRPYELIMEPEDVAARSEPEVALYDRIMARAA